MPSRNWDKQKRQDRARKPMNAGEFKRLRLARLMAYRAEHPETKDLPLPRSLR